MTLFFTILITLIALLQISVLLEKKKEAKLIEELSSRAQKLNSDAIALKVSSAHLPHGGHQSFELVMHEEKFELSWTIKGHIKRGFIKPQGYVKTENSKAKELYQELKKLGFSKRKSEVKQVKDGWRVHLIFIENQQVYELDFVCPESNEKAVSKLLSLLKKLTESNN